MSEAAKVDVAVPPADAGKDPFEGMSEEIHKFLMSPLGRGCVLSLAASAMLVEYTSGLVAKLVPGITRDELVKMTQACGQIAMTRGPDIRDILYPVATASQMIKTTWNLVNDLPEERTAVDIAANRMMLSPLPFGSNVIVVGAPAGTVDSLVTSLPPATRAMVLDSKQSLQAAAAMPNGSVDLYVVPDAVDLFSRMLPGDPPVHVKVLDLCRRMRKVAADTRVSIVAFADVDDTTVQRVRNADEGSHLRVVRWSADCGNPAFWPQADTPVAKPAEPKIVLA